MTQSNKFEISGEDVTLVKDEGILKQILREGSGDEKPFKGDTVYVHYDGQLLDGTKFDSSRDRGEKFSFKVGENAVIKGWDLGIPTMKKGELSRFIIKSEYGYGATGSPPTIPPNATLVFDVELFEFEGEDLSQNNDKSIFRRVIKAGGGYSNPNDGARVVIDIKGLDKDNRVFDERDNIEFEIGDGLRFDVVEGVEHALTKFKKDEHSIVYLKSRRAWGAEGNKKFNIPPNTDVAYEVTLKSFEKAKEAYQLNSSEKLEQSELMKNRGNELLVEKKYSIAVKKYQKIIEYLQSEIYDLEEQQESSRKLQLAAHLNMAASYLKMKEFREALQSCEKALEMEPKNEKGLFRKAQSQFGMGFEKEAITTFNQVLEVNPNNKDASNQILLCKKKIKDTTEKEKAMYTKMFMSK
jgi:FK506-binding protein 4/5